MPSIVLTRSIHSCSVADLFYHLSSSLPSSASRQPWEHGAELGGGDGRPLCSRCRPDICRASLVPRKGHASQAVDVTRPRGMRPARVMIVSHSVLLSRLCLGRRLSSQTSRTSILSVTVHASVSVHSSAPDTLFCLIA